MLSKDGFERFKAEREAQGAYHQGQMNIKDLLETEKAMWQESAKREEAARQAQNENTITMIEIFIPIIFFIILIVFLAKKYKTLEPIIFEKLFRCISILSSLALIAFIVYRPSQFSSVLRKEQIIIIIPVLTLACINLCTLLKLSRISLEDNLNFPKANILSNIIRRKKLEDEIKTLEAEKRIKELKGELHKTTTNIETEEQKNIISLPSIQEDTQKQETILTQDSCINNQISSPKDSTIHVSNEQLPQISPAKLIDSSYTKDEVATLSPILSSKGLLSINGRRSRKQYFIVSLFLSFFNNAFNKLPVADEIWFLILPFLLFVTYLQLVNTTKRFHDLDKPTAYAIAYCILAILLTTFYDITQIYNITTMRLNTSSLFTVVLLVVWIIRIYLIFTPGTDGSNHYGRSIEELKKSSN